MIMQPLIKLLLHLQYSCTVLLYIYNFIIIVFVATCMFHHIMLCAQTCNLFSSHQINLMYWIRSVESAWLLVCSRFLFGSLKLFTDSLSYCSAFLACRVQATLQTTLFSCVTVDRSNVLLIKFSCLLCRRRCRRLTPLPFHWGTLSPRSSSSFFIRLWFTLSWFLWSALGHDVMPAPPTRLSITYGVTNPPLDRCRTAQLPCAREPVSSPPLLPTGLRTGVGLA